MADSDASERTHDPTPRRLQQARERGDVPASREGSAAAVLIAALLAVLLTGGMVAMRVGEIILPLLERTETFVDMTSEGLNAAAQAVGTALAVALLPMFGLLFVGAALPYLLQNNVVVSLTRITPKLSNLSPGNGLKRMFGLRALFEFAKGIVKTLVVGAACYTVGHKLYANSIVLVSVDLVTAPQMMGDAIVSLLAAATVVAVIVAGIDVPYQHFTWWRRQRMSFQDLRDEMRSAEGDPHIKARFARLRRMRAQRRMMHDVPKASVVITNPTHFAVALRYRRGKDAAPMVVAKGQDLIALRIREVARQHGVAVVEDPPLARALHAAVEIGDMIPRAHFEAVAKIVGLVWARRAGARESRE